jgi:hypothetical protein
MGHRSEVSRLYEPCILLEYATAYGGPRAPGFGPSSKLCLGHLEGQSSALGIDDDPISIRYERQRAPVRGFGTYMADTHPTCGA